MGLSALVAVTKEIRLKFCGIEVWTLDWGPMMIIHCL